VDPVIDALGNAMTVTLIRLETTSQQIRGELLGAGIGQSYRLYWLVGAPVDRENRRTR
jgi:hypothetical protein